MSVETLSPCFSIYSKKYGRIGLSSESAAHDKVLTQKLRAMCGMWSTLPIGALTNRLLSELEFETGGGRGARV
ncbi:hypothetical protein EVAR_97968_1 [Eumeta japonica]|uniref:Uncharacterized protein n=1 Tax=Eumeta variegata TaxID=151549 RepID=A0A4C1XHV1_EUMVA|nr:hypothetical protein EVAR_97968_1 [Eumeta japonica]